VAYVSARGGAPPSLLDPCSDELMGADALGTAAHAASTLYLAHEVPRLPSSSWTARAHSPG